MRLSKTLWLVRGLSADLPDVGEFAETFYADDEVGAAEEFSAWLVELGAGEGIPSEVRPLRLPAPALYRALRSNPLQRVH